MLDTSKTKYAHQRSSTPVSSCSNTTDEAEDQGEAEPSSKKRRITESKTKKKNTNVELLSILEKQVQLMEQAQEKEDRMMSTLLEMEQKSEERQKSILMALIDKL